MSLFYEMEIRNAALEPKLSLLIAIQSRDEDESVCRILICPVLHMNPLKEECDDVQEYGL